MRPRPGRRWRSESRLDRSDDGADDLVSRHRRAAGEAAGRLRRDAGRCGTPRMPKPRRRARRLGAPDRRADRTAVVRCRWDWAARPTMPTRMRSWHRRDDLVMTTARPERDGGTRRAHRGRSEGPVGRWSEQRRRRSDQPHGPGDRPCQCPDAVQRAARLVARRDPDRRAATGRAVRPRPRREHRGGGRAGGAGEAHASTGSSSIGGASATVVRAEGVRHVPARRSSRATSSRSLGATRSSSTASCSRATDLELDESMLTGESEPMAKDVGSDVAVRLLGRRGNRSAPRRSRRRGVLRAPTRGRRPPVRASRRSELRSRDRRDPRAASHGCSSRPRCCCSCRSGRRRATCPRRCGSRWPVSSTWSRKVSCCSRAPHSRSASCGWCKRRVLVGELGALEGLARVDVLCVDKTGTLTDGQPELVADRAADRRHRRRPRVAGFAASDPDPNASLHAILRARAGRRMAGDVAGRVLVRATVVGHRCR